MLSHINIGAGRDCTIRELAELIAETVGYQGSIAFDSSKPDGAPRKLLDISKMSRMGWSPQYDLKTGLETTYQWYLASEASGRAIRDGGTEALPR